MLKSLFVLNSDQINKHGSCFAISAMEDMVWDKSTEAVPMHLGHDMHRPIGCMVPFGLYFEPKIVRNLGLSLIPETDEENKQILDFKKFSAYSNIKEDIDSNNGALHDILKDNLSGNFKYLHSSTLAIIDEGIVNKVFKKLSSLKVKDDLIQIKDLLIEFDYKFQGVFIHKTLPLCIYADSFFRRSLSRHNCFHYNFLDKFMLFKDNEEVVLKIAIDWDLIGYAPTLLQTMEFDYWFGPKYTDEIDKIEPGLTKHLTNEFERNYYQLSSTEFFWKINKNLREFELEELIESEAPTLHDFYGCRYIHSIYDTNKSTFVHFDGAIRGYDSDLYFERIDKKMTEFGRRSQYKKLFRMDGKIEINDWKSLITHYMQSNPLIYEYFNAEKPKSELEKPIENISLMEELVPQKIDENEGIKLLVSYHEKNNNFSEYTHTVSIYDLIDNGNGNADAIEEDIIEVKKAIERLGKKLFIKKEVLYGNFKDEYWNIPCIFHSLYEPSEDIIITIQALKNIFNKLIERKLNSVISFTLAWNIEEREVRLSCFGHVNDLIKWMNTFTSIPTKRVEFKSWLENQRTYLNSNYEQFINKPALKDICQYDGVIYIKRKIVEQIFNPKPIMRDESLVCQLQIPSDGRNYDDILENRIVPIMTYFIKKATCSKTGKSYYDSPYSKFLDDDVHVIIEDIEGLTFYWSDKPI
ncbi:MAG: hypothetical protein RI980_1157 [Bacteroidota bacterium]|jgi:hypothetical protein